VDADPGPFAAALRLPHAPPPLPAAPSPASASERGAEKGLQALVDRFKNEPGGRIVIGSLPVRVAFPSFGPSVFLAAELTAEATTPSVDLLVKRAK
jgi:hypothetical protein